MKIIERIRERLGLVYIVNRKTKEIHYEPMVHMNCGLDYSKMRNLRYVTERTAIRLISNKGYDGCFHCFRKYNDYNGTEG